MQWKRRRSVGLLSKPLRRLSAWREKAVLVSARGVKGGGRAQPFRAACSRLPVRVLAGIHALMIRRGTSFLYGPTVLCRSQHCGPFCVHVRLAQLSRPFLRTVALRCIRSVKLSASTVKLISSQSGIISYSRSAVLGCPSTALNLARTFLRFALCVLLEL